MARLNLASKSNNMILKSRFLVLSSHLHLTLPIPAFSALLRMVIYTLSILALFTPYQVKSALYPYNHRLHFRQAYPSKAYPCNPSKAYPGNLQALSPRPGEVLLFHEQNKTSMFETNSFGVLG